MILSIGITILRRSGCRKKINDNSCGGIAMGHPAYAHFTSSMLKSKIYVISATNDKKKHLTQNVGGHALLTKHDRVIFQNTILHRYYKIK